MIGASRVGAMSVDAGQHGGEEAEIPPEQPGAAEDARQGAEAAPLGVCWVAGGGCSQAAS